MTKKRRSARQEREEVLSAYGTARLEEDPDAPVVDELRTLETLLRLKAERLDSPDPGMWSEDLARRLLTEIVPRTVVQRREQVMDMVPALRRLALHLQATGRWHQDSVTPDALPVLLHQLEFEALEAADDPSRRTWSTNVLGYGLSRGVDLEDDEALEDYMHWYNALGDEERTEISSTGRLREPSTPFDLESARRARLAEEGPSAADPSGAGPSADDPSAPSWPWFLPLPDDDGDALPDPAEQRDVGPYLDSVLVTRARIVLDVVGGGRRATVTGALGREDTQELLRRLGLEDGARSLWDRPEAAGVWVTLLDGGWLELDGDRVRAVRGPVPLTDPREDPEGFIEFGHALLTAALLGRQAREVEDGGLRGLPDTLAALLAACSPEGLRLPPRTGPGLHPELPAPDDLERLVRVLHDLGVLADCGVLTHADGIYRGGPEVMMALIGLLHRS